MAERMISMCVLLWARPGEEAALADYEDRVLAVLAEHGGRVVRRGAVAGGTAGAPTEVQFLEIPGEDTLDAYLNDPRRLALADDRDAAIARTDVLRLRPR